MWGWNSGGSSLGSVIIFLAALPIGLIISFVLNKIYKNKQVLNFLSAWSCYLLILSLWFLVKVNDSQDKIQVIYLIGVSLVLSIIFLYFSYKKSLNTKKTTSSIIVNFIVLGLVIFLLNL